MKFGGLYRVGRSDETIAHDIQCMECKGHFWMALLPWEKILFCPVCGVKFTGRMPARRPQWIPRWAWNRYRVQEDNDWDLPRHIRDRLYAMDVVPKGPHTGHVRWIIERRYRWHNDTDWEPWSQWEHGPWPTVEITGNAKGAKLHLDADCRSRHDDSDFLQQQYRARLAGGSSSGST